MSDTLEPGECGGCGEMIPAGVTDEEHDRNCPARAVSAPPDREDVLEDQVRWLDATLRAVLEAVFTQGGVDLTAQVTRQAVERRGYYREAMANHPVEKMGAYDV